MSINFKPLLVLVCSLVFSVNVFADCSWSEPGCVADDIDDVAEGTWVEPIVKPVTQEIREIGEEDD